MLAVDLQALFDQASLGRRKAWLKSRCRDTDLLRLLDRLVQALGMRGSRRVPAAASA